MKSLSSSSFSDSKPHYELLDGLRGVAALVVIWYHIFEGFASSPADQVFNHGYLAVDFFFILSGFVVGYAYDDRLRKSMTVKEFFSRRLIRLHPLVVLGVLIGAVTFCIQGCVRWDGTDVPFWAVVLAMGLNLFLIPAYPGSPAEVRGYGEMYPLNGPNWSLFFEYIGNVLYAFVLSRLSVRKLRIVVFVSGLCLMLYALFNFSGFHNLGVGWTLGGLNFPGGFLRMFFAFSAGILISRRFRPVKIRGAFWICSALLIVFLSLPYAGTESAPWLNGLYDALCAVLLFPLLVYLGASGTASDRFTSSVCRFLGNISYPVYIVHYPFAYLFFAWLWKGDGVQFSEAWPYALLLFVGSILLSYIVLKVYDIPVRRILYSRKYERD